MTRVTNAALASLFGLLLAAPASPQDVPDFSLRPFVMGIGQRFAATTTFDAAFDDHVQPMFGGGLNITQENRYYLELSASRFEKTGQRAFLNSGQLFRLGIPLTVTITPLELTAGYRFTKGRRPVIPYLGAGAGLYRYKETSDFEVDGDAVDTQHVGGILEGGVEFRLHRWIGVAADAHFTYVPGILGEAGISNEADEKSLGGISARFKVIVGR